MNIPILIASILTLVAFVVHAFVGDKELKMIEPRGDDEKYLKQEKWTMARSGWHWVSVDLLFAALGLLVINFSNYFENEQMLLEVLTFYFFAYGISWLVGIVISRKFPMNYLKLGQWIFCWLVSAIIYWGIVVGNGAY